MSDETGQNFEFFRLKITEVVWDRILKRLAFLVAVGAAALAVFGITSWRDVNASIAQIEKDALDRVDAAAAEAIDKRMAEIEDVYANLTLRMTDDLIASVRSTATAEAEITRLIARIEDSSRRIEDLERAVQTRAEEALIVFSTAEENWTLNLRAGFEARARQALEAVAPDLDDAFRLRFDRFESDSRLVGYDEATAEFAVNAQRIDTYGLSHYTAYSAFFHLSMVNTCAGSDAWASVESRQSFDDMRIGLTLFLMDQDLDMDQVSFYRAARPAYFYYHALNAIEDEAGDALSPLIPDLAALYSCGDSTDDIVAGFAELIAARTSIVPTVITEAFERALAARGG